MIVNSKIKCKYKIMIGVIRNLVLDFILYFVTAYMRKCPIHTTSAQGITQNTLYNTKYIIQHKMQDKIHYTTQNTTQNTLYIT